MHQAAATGTGRKSRFAIIPPEQAMEAARMGLPLGAAEMCAIYQLSHGRFYQNQAAGKYDHLRLPNSDDGDRRRYSGAKVYRELMSEETIRRGRRPTPRRGTLKAAERHK